MALSIKKEILTFIKAQGSATFATACDYAMRLFLDKVIDFNYLTATFLGALTGGIVNCLVNYNFAFRNNGVHKKDVAARYFIIWAGSICLNTAGTGFFKGYVHIPAYLAMLLTSLLVAFFWNYLLQRSFVFHSFRKKGKGL